MSERPTKPSVLVPSTATVKVRSRWDDGDRYGHVNNAAYLALVRAAHDRADMPTGEIRLIEIAYRQPVPTEVMVDVEVGVLDEDRSHRRIAYHLRSRWARPAGPQRHA